MARLREIRHVALDMDGTIYRGKEVFGFTNPFLAELKEWGIGCTFLTNNSSKSTAEYRDHLEKLGVATAGAGLYISTHATVEYLQLEQPQVRRLLVVGTDGLKADLAAAGYTLIPDSSAEKPDAVVVGFDPSLDFASLCRAAWWLRQGCLFVATHPDWVCPTDDPTVLMDCGSLCAALTAATGRQPDAIPGKPDPRMLQGLIQREGIRPEQMAMAGDRIYTDIEMARRAGALGVLVLSGEATRQDASQAQPPPDLVVQDLAEFAGLLKSARADQPG